MSDEELAALSGHPLRHKSAVLSTLLAEARACHAADEARQLHSGADSSQQVGPPLVFCRRQACAHAAASMAGQMHMLLAGSVRRCRPGVAGRCIASASARLRP
jgi:hypothetical protein